MQIIYRKDEMSHQKSHNVEFLRENLRVRFFMTTPGVAPHPWVVPVVAAQCTDYQYTEGFTQGSYLEAGAKYSVY
jgi:hypothetical protein